MEMKKRLIVIPVVFLCTLYIMYQLNTNVRQIDDIRPQHLLVSRLEEFRLVMESSMPVETRCYDEPSTSESFPELDAHRERELIGGLRRNIFFLETSCFGEGGQSLLNCRQACSVEAAARSNPNMSVNLFYLSPAPPSNLTKRLLQHLHTYDNFQVCRLKVAEYIHDTPIEYWYSSGILAECRWPNMHMCNFLRLLTLWKYGGIYMDLDMVAITSLDNLTNFVGYQSNDSSNSAVMGLNSTGLGFKVASECLSDLMKSYRGDSWCDSSCGLLSRVTQKLCYTKNLNEMTPDRCGGFQVFPPATFYPFSYEQKELNKFFTSTNHTTEMMRQIKAARTIHIWNYLSQNLMVRKGAPYAQIAEQYCPLIYKQCDDKF